MRSCSNASFHSSDRVALHVCFFLLLSVAAVCAQDQWNCQTPECVGHKAGYDWLRVVLFPSKIATLLANTTTHHLPRDARLPSLLNSDGRLRVKR